MPIHPTLTALLVVALLLLGCGRPNQANIELRKENQSLRQKIEQLERLRSADRAAIRAIEAQIGTLPTLPQERLEQMFTVHGLKFGRLTGGADLDPDQPGDEALKIYVVPIDSGGDELKAAGSFTVEAFDLSVPDSPLIGRWEFPAAQAQANWYGQGLMYGYVLSCPWQKVPNTDRLTVKVTFLDELTQRVFDAQKMVKIDPPPAAPTPG